MPSWSRHSVGFGQTLISWPSVSQHKNNAGIKSKLKTKKEKPFRLFGGPQNAKNSRIFPLLASYHSLGCCGKKLIGFWNKRGFGRHPYAVRAPHCLGCKYGPEYIRFGFIMTDSDPELKALCWMGWNPDRALFWFFFFLVWEDGPWKSFSTSSRL